MSKNLRRRFLTVVIQTFIIVNEVMLEQPDVYFRYRQFFSFVLRKAKHRIDLLFVLQIDETEREEEKCENIGMKKDSSQSVFRDADETSISFFFLFLRKSFLFLILKLTFSQAKRRDYVSVDGIFLQFHFYILLMKKQTSMIIVAYMLRRSKEVVETPSSC